MPEESEGSSNPTPVKPDVPRKSDGKKTPVGTPEAPSQHSKGATPVRPGPVKGPLQGSDFQRRSMTVNPSIADSEEDETFSESSSPVLCRSTSSSPKQKGHKGSLDPEEAPDSYFEGKGQFKKKLEKRKARGESQEAIMDLPAPKTPETLRSKARLKPFMLRRLGLEN